tara:strand:- start:440 stop:1144 length:705 start_codon:yes stop_codon:yes gene_type:complete
MASILKVDKLDPQSGTALEIGTSGDTVTVPTGVGLTLTDSTLLLPTTITSTTEVKTNKISPATGTAFAMGDSGDTFTVPVGATIVNSGTATGFGGGKLLQVVSTRSTTHYTTTTSSWQPATNFTVDITPSSISSKVLVFAHTNVNNTVSLSGAGTYVTLFRDTTDLGPNGFLFHANASGSSYYTSSTGAFHYLDSPASVATLTYHIQFMANPGNTANVGYNNSYTDITAMEIGA